jgi:Raf kinase inhibitor-like YbhB/YbcL family protein
MDMICVSRWSRVCAVALVRIAAFSLSAVPAACSSTNASMDAGATGNGDGASAGSDGGGVPSDAAGADAGAEGGAAGFTLTSPAFVDGQSMPTANTCAGVDTSPELDWTAGPAGTMSYALVLTDVSINLVHWVIWDIAQGTRSLQAMLPADAVLGSPANAMQVALRGQGYAGPCPNGNVHMYQFELHAMDVATLPGVTTTSTSANAKSAVLAHSIAHTDLVGTSDARRVSDASGQ